MWFKEIDTTPRPYSDPQQILQMGIMNLRVVNYYDNEATHSLHTHEYLLKRPLKRAFEFLTLIIAFGVEIRIF